jgi:CDP-4-dehydro-6-deoxyglucose reductase
MAFKIELQPSGHSFEVPPDKTVLLAGLEAGFHMPYSCRVGTCRTCRGTIKSGRVDYGDVRPTYLPDIDKAKASVILGAAASRAETAMRPTPSSAPSGPLVSIQ